MRQTSRLVGVLLVVLLGGLAWLAVDAVARPYVVPASAPADQFSGERAFQHVTQIGQQVHVPDRTRPVRSVSTSSTR